MSFRLKTVLGIAAIEIVLLSILLVSGLNYLKSSNEEQLFNRARTTANLLGTMIADALVALDLATIDALLSETIKNPEIVYVRVRSKNGLAIAEKGDETFLKRPFHPDANVEDIGNDGVFDAASSVIVSNNEFGRVELGLNIRTLQVVLADAQRDLLFLAGLEVFLVGIFGYLLGRILTRQLASLQKGARRVAQGELGYTISVKGDDELADTARSFNNMSVNLEDYANRLNEARMQAETGRDTAVSILEDAMESLHQGVVIADEGGQVLHVNSAFKELYGLSAEQVSQNKNLEGLSQLSWRRCDKGKVFAPDKSGNLTHRTQLSSGHHVYHSQQKMTIGGSVFTDTDITQIIEAEEKVRMLERDLLQSQRMEALGTLAGGIAHEINTPIQYIGDNLRFLKETSEDLFTVIGIQNNLVDAAESAGLLSQEAVECRTAYKSIDVDFLREEIPQAAEQSIDGIRQVSTIVQAMKEFSYPTSAERGPVDLNRCIERTSVVCRSEWKPVAELELDLQDDLPTLYGHEGQLNQVILNLLVNAAHAIKEKSTSLGRIVVRTICAGDEILFSVEDTGAGMSRDVQDRIFEPFFTTKEVGKGTGQGLALCHDIVINKHEGRLEVKSDEGIGTTFTVIVPIANADLQALDGNIIA